MARLLALAALGLGLAACGGKGESAPDLNCAGAHTCPSSQKYDYTVCACVDAPDLAASVPLDLGDTD